MPERPFSQACENNKQPILDIIRPLMSQLDLVLEVGSGTGQHAVHFAGHMPALRWQPSDQAEYLPGIRAWRDWAALPNLLAPLELDVRSQQWPVSNFNGLFSANTAHIMAWQQVEEFFAGIGRHLAPGGVFCLYGPFNYGGQFTSQSNARFDLWLKDRDPLSGIRDFEAIETLAKAAGLELVADHAMPANNRLLHWQKRRSTDL